MVFHGRREEKITLCDVSYVPDLKFNVFCSTRHSIHMIIILDAAGAYCYKD